MRAQFQLMICFVGSAACNPQLSGLMCQFWDVRFFFPAWNEELMQKLFQQQEDLKRRGINRQVCILVDDVVLSSGAEDQLAHLAMRGRHFNISLFMAAVSYTTLPKRVRRSLDVLLVYSCPMQGDRKVLTWEFSHQSRMAEYVLKNLGQYECLVMETLSKQQQLFIWKSDVVSHRTQSGPRTVRAESQTEPSPGKSEERSSEPHQNDTDAPPDRTQFSEADAKTGEAKNE